MAQNYRTDLEHLNKLYRINNIYDSPKMISNYPEIKNPNKIILNKLSPYTYFPTYKKLLKKNNLYSPIIDKKMQTIYNPRPNKYSSFIFSENKLSPLRPRIHNNSTDYTTRANCKNLKDLFMDDESRMIDVYWQKEKSAAYNVDIEIYSNDRDGLLTDIISNITATKAKLIVINSRATKERIVITEITLEVENLEELNQVLKTVRKVDSVYEVKRKK